MVDIDSEYLGRFPFIGVISPILRIIRGNEIGPRHIRSTGYFIDLMIIGFNGSIPKVQPRERQ